MNNPNPPRSDATFSLLSQARIYSAVQRVSTFSPANAQRAPLVAAEQRLNEATTVILYSLGDEFSSDKTAEVFHRSYPVLGKIGLKGAEAKRATRAFQDAITIGTKQGIALCFEPHHAIRVENGGHVYDYLLCYTCSGLVMYDDSKEILAIAAHGFPNVLNGLLAAHRIAIAPTATAAYVANERKQERALAKKMKQDEARWIAAMPEMLRVVWKQRSMSGQTEADAASLGALRAALAKQYHDDRTRIRALLALNGSGAGPWSGFPAYEQAGDDLLLDFSTASLVDAIQTAALSPRQMEGAGRLFAGWDFRRQRPDDIKKLPGAVTSALLGYVRKTAGQDKDKLERAEEAFSGA